MGVCRTDEFAADHIPNVINGLNQSIGITEIFELSDKNQLVRTYCHSGHPGKDVAMKLVALGYEYCGVQQNHRLER